MIQRIQSVLLVFVLVGIILMFIFPVATYSLEDVAGTKMKTELNLFPKESPSQINQADYINPIYLPITATVLGILTLIIIFMYRNRILQIRMIAVAVLINLAYIALVFFLAVDGYAKILQEQFKTSVHISYFVGTYIPLVTIALLIWAQNAVKKDERKVRSADRLR